jgi:dephospho-CoA kinase
VPIRVSIRRERSVRRVKELGLTGNIGSGKSTVAERLASRGAAVIDADALARRATEDPEVLERIAAALGDDLVVEGRLDRARTAERVFADERARRALEAIVHPAVRRAVEERVRDLRQRADPPPLVVHDVPLLFENDMENRFDATAVVVAPLHVRIERVVDRGGITAEDARQRDAAQLPQEEKARQATYVIDNAGSPDALDAQLDRLWRDLVDAQR